MTTDIANALHQVAARYAAGVDRRDLGVFLSAFEPEGSLWIPSRGPGVEPVVLRGHGELAQVIERIGRYDRTFHLLGQTALGSAAGDIARAETYCVAHHWLATGDLVEDTVLHIRYEDEYRRGGDGEWRLSTRRLTEDAREIRDVSPRREGA